MAAWTNRTTVSAAPPSGSSAAVTIPFAAAASGSLLVFAHCSSAIVTMPAGWTRQAQALNFTDTSVWTKTAMTGESSAAATVSANGYVVVGVVLEFPPGSAWVNDVSATGAGYDAANPNLTGLTGTNLVGAVWGCATTATATTFNTTWTSPTAANTDLQVGPTNGVDGAGFSLGVIESYASAAYGPTANNTTIPGGGLSGSSERITFAVNVAAPSSSTVTAVAATSSASARVPSLSAVRVAAVAGVAALASSLAPTPTVAGIGDGHVSAIVATSTALAEPPAVTGETLLAGGGPASASSQGRAPTVTTGAVVPGARATATATALPPTVGTTSAGTVAATMATSTTSARAPIVTGTATGVTIAPAAASTGAARAPGVTAVRVASVSTPTASATTSARAPGVSGADEEARDLDLDVTPNSPRLQLAIAMSRLTITGGPMHLYVAAGSAEYVTVAVADAGHDLAGVTWEMGLSDDGDAPPTEWDAAVVSVDGATVSLSLLVDAATTAPGEHYPWLRAIDTPETIVRPLGTRVTVKD